MRFRLLCLRLSNILSHKNSVIPLGHLTAACIQGRNGGGKSTIITALLWVWFGVSDRGKASLIRNGEKEATGIVEFEMDGVRYQMLRKHNTSKKTVVELRTWDMNSGVWHKHPIATGEAATGRVCDMLSRSFQTMTTANVLLQGQGERFISLKPGARSSVVFEIMGSTIWESRRHRAASRVYTETGALKELRRLHGEDLAQAERIPELTVELQTAQEALALVRTLLAEHDHSLQEHSGKEAVARMEVEAKKDVERLHGTLVAEEERAQREVVRLSEALGSQEPSADVTAIIAMPDGERLCKHNETASDLNAILAAEQELRQASERKPGLVARRDDLQRQEREALLLIAEEPAIVDAEKSLAELAVRIDSLAVSRSKAEGRLILADHAIKAHDAQREELVTRSNQLTTELERLRALVGNQDKISQAEVELVQHEATLVEYRASLQELQAMAEDFGGALQQCAELERSIAESARIVADHEAVRKREMAKIQEQIDAAEKTGALLNDPVPCGGEGEFAACRFIKYAAEARHKVPELKEQLEKASAPVDIPEIARIAELTDELKWLDRAALQKRRGETLEAADALKVQIKETEDLAAACKMWVTQSKELAAARELIKRTTDDQAATEEFLRQINERINEENERKRIAAGELREIDQQGTDLVREQEPLREKASKRAELDAALRDKDRLAAALTDATVQLEQLEARMAELLVRCKAKDDVERRLSLFQQARQRIETEASLIDVRAKLTEASAAVERTKQQLADLGDPQARLDELRAAIAGLKAKIEEYRAAEQREISAIARTEEQLKQVQGILAGAQKTAQELADRERKLQVMVVLEAIYEKIPYYILDTVLPLIEDEANSVLEQISSSGMRIQLKSERARGKGTEDVLDIIVSDHAGERVIELYSGGEKTRVVLALTVGLRQLSIRRSNLDLGFLFIDEPAGLDKEGMRQFGECLLKLVNNGYFSQAFLVAHDETLKSIFGQQILVTKTGTESRVEVRA